MFLINLLVVALCTVFIFHLKRISTQCTPPGPKGLPLIGAYALLVVLLDYGLVQLRQSPSCPSETPVDRVFED
jgi:hypothetical protein